FVHTQLHKRAGHSILLKSWPILSLLHLKMESTPATRKDRVIYLMELIAIEIDFRSGGLIAEECRVQLAPTAARGHVAKGTP
ncbi:hypothetical protein, partial [Rhizobium sp. Root1203]|uniref:hypothetical protein n=1 Tax=Rhizobium sp. Root1203 TaxID=1736427 RepID=UPI001AECADE5